jgi:hypothetical protein
LDLRLWLRDGVLRADVHHTDVWRWWHDAQYKEQDGAVGYEVNTRDPGRAWVRLFYTLTDTGEHVDYRVALQTTGLHFGGRRFWFTCPLVVNGTPCGRRVGQLYLPPGSRYFGCRQCYRLTYLSCRESHMYDATARWLAAHYGGDFRRERRRLALRGKTPWWQF